MTNATASGDVDPGEMERCFQALESQFAERRDWYNVRNEAGLSPLAERLVLLDDEYRQEYGAPGYRHTFAAVLYFAVEPLYEDPADVPPTPSIPTDTAWRLVDAFTDEHPQDLVDAFAELHTAHGPTDGRAGP